MSPNMTSLLDESVDTPILAWLALPPGEPGPSVRPKVLCAHVPLVALTTAPGAARLSSQHVTGVDAVFVGISLGFPHQLATRSGTLPSSAETSCQGGTWRC